MINSVKLNFTTLFHNTWNNHYLHWRFIFRNTSHVHQRCRKIIWTFLGFVTNLLKPIISYIFLPIICVFPIFASFNLLFIVIKLHRRLEYKNMIASSFVIQTIRDHFSSSSLSLFTILAHYFFFCVISKVLYFSTLFFVFHTKTIHSIPIFVVYLNLMFLLQVWHPVFFLFLKKLIVLIDNYFVLASCYIYYFTRFTIPYGSTFMSLFS